MSVWTFEMGQSRIVVRCAGPRPTIAELVAATAALELTNRLRHRAA